jgi:hypothetical protein
MKQKPLWTHGFHLYTYVWHLSILLPYRAILNDKSLIPHRFVGVTWNFIKKTRYLRPWSLELCRQHLNWWLKIIITYWFLSVVWLWRWIFLWRAFFNFSSELDFPRNVSEIAFRVWYIEFSCHTGLQDKCFKSMNSEFVHIVSPPQSKHGELYRLFRNMLPFNYGFLTNHSRRNINLFIWKILEFHFIVDENNVVDVVLNVSLPIFVRKLVCCIYSPTRNQLHSL